MGTERQPIALGNGQPLGHKIENARNPEFVSGFRSCTTKISFVIAITDSQVIVSNTFDRLRTRQVAKNCHEVGFSGVFYGMAFYERA